MRAILPEVSGCTFLTGMNQNESRSQGPGTGIPWRWPRSHERWGYGTGSKELGDSYRDFLHKATSSVQTRLKIGSVKKNLYTN